MLIKSPCPRCGDPLEFEAEFSGSRIECPHCRGSVTITAPKNYKPPEPEHKPAASIEPKSPDPIETKLESASEIFTGLGATIMLLAFVGGLMAFTTAGIPGLIIPMIGGIAVFVQCWMISILFRGFAEVIRLLRVRK